MCMCTHAHRHWKKVREPLELELPDMGAETKVSLLEKQKVLLTPELSLQPLRSNKLLIVIVL